MRPDKPFRRHCAQSLGDLQRVILFFDFSIASLVVIGFGAAFESIHGYARDMH
jgi:hypothetical protein